MSRLVTGSDALRWGETAGRSAATLDEVLDLERRRGRPALIWAVLSALVILASAWHAGLLDGRRLAEGAPALWQLATEMVPPDFSRIMAWWGPLIDTIAMSIAGTSIAVLLSLPLGFLAARNTSPHRLLYLIARTGLNGLRSVPELIMGIIFVAAVGFGALPGVLALGIHSIGMVGKFFAEAIEHVDPAPIEAAEAAGASHMQVVIHAILPQILPQVADVSIYRWEYNFRASTVLGAVGAGGIGFELIAALRIMHYREVSAIIIVVLLAVTIVDVVGAFARRRLV